MYIFWHISLREQRALVVDVYKHYVEDMIWRLSSFVASTTFSFASTIKANMIDHIVNYKFYQEWKHFHCIFSTKVDMNKKCCRLNIVYFFEGMLNPHRPVSIVVIMCASYFSIDSAQGRWFKSSTGHVFLFIFYPLFFCAFFYFYLQMILISIPFQQCWMFCYLFERGNPQSSNRGWVNSRFFS